MGGILTSQEVKEMSSLWDINPDTLVFLILAAILVTAWVVNHFSENRRSNPFKKGKKVETSYDFTVHGIEENTSYTIAAVRKDNLGQLFRLEEVPCYKDGRPLWIHHNYFRPAS
jgi:hypothetical protein